MPIDPISAALLAASAGTTLAGIFGGRRTPSIDISGELSRIGDLYNEQREFAKTSSKEQLQDLNKLTASDLAGRGILSSPVSEYSFGANRAQAQRSLAAALAGISSSEAGQRASLLERLTGVRARQDELAGERRRAGLTQLSALLASAGAAYGRGEADNRPQGSFDFERFRGAGQGTDPFYYLRRSGFEGPNPPFVQSRLFGQ